MTETMRPATAERLERSLLFSPATSERFFAKAQASAADTIIIDIEDAVAPDKKAEGRRRTIEVLGDMDWGRKTMGVRINALDTQWAYRDVVELAEGCPRLDLIMLPKVERHEDVVALATFLGSIERAIGRMNPIAILPIVETAMGLTHVEAIVSCSLRVTSATFGPGDFAVSMGNRSPIVGAPDPDYMILTGPDANGVRHGHWNDVWHYARARMATACRAHGVRALDGVFADFKDEEGLRVQSLGAVAMGYEGKALIHPAQVDVVNEVFAPSAKQIEWARGVLDAMAQAQAAGNAAVTFGGAMIDLAHIKQANRILNQLAQIEVANG